MSEGSEFLTRHGNHQVAVITSLHTQRVDFSLSRGWQIVGPLQQLENTRADLLKARPTVPLHPPEVPAQPQLCPLWPSHPSTSNTNSHSKRKSGSAFLSDDESDFIAEPAKKKCGRPRKVCSDSEVEEVVQKAPKKKLGPKPKPKPRAMPKVKQRKSIKENTCLGLGERRDGGNEETGPTYIYVSVSILPSSLQTNNTLELIHETIGCEGLVTDTKAKMTTKKDLSVVIPVFPDNYMLSLHTMTKKKPAASTKKKGKMTFIDLNNNDSAGENDNDRKFPLTKIQSLPTRFEPVQTSLYFFAKLRIVKDNNLGPVDYLVPRCRWAVRLSHDRKYTQQQGEVEVCVQDELIREAITLGQGKFFLDNFKGEFSSLICMLWWWF
ncbi:hypothetical protein B0H14DRAFT_2651489 [Mycena olivaceomarginata]|nr:hypothetical protein B0H14DRAFT_2651489 [Mycena olivaceomarginata]